MGDDGSKGSGLDNVKHLYRPDGNPHAQRKGGAVCHEVRQRNASVKSSIGSMN